MNPNINPTPAAPAVPPVVYISFSAEITPQTTESLIAVVGNCVNEGHKHAYIMISTPGGTVMNGINIYNVLRALPIEITMHNVGNVDSIGNVVFLAGQNRYACPHSTFMFHGVGFDTPGPIRLEQAMMEEKTLSILTEHKRIGTIMEEHTTLSAEQIAELFKGQRTEDSAYAVGCGIVSEIRDVNIPEGAPIVSLVFQR